LADRDNSVPSNGRSDKSKKSKTGSTELSKADQDELRVIASKFTYMSLLWLRKPESTFKLDPDSIDDYEPVHRFDNSTNKIYGQFLELQAAIPKKLRAAMADDDFISIVWVIFVSIMQWLYLCYNQFRHEMGQQRSNGSKRVCREAGTAIFSCLDEDLGTGKAHFEKFAELIGWFEKDGKAGYQPWAPILYEEGDGPAFDRIFKNPILLRVITEFIIIILLFSFIFPN
jgi:hypothetical protein